MAWGVIPSGILSGSACYITPLIGNGDLFFLCHSESGGSFVLANIDQVSRDENSHYYIGFGT